MCADATEWKTNPHLCNSSDLLLVNLPHDSIEHLPHLLPLLRKGQTSLLRGWAIIDRDNEATEKNKIAAAIIDAGGTIESLQFEEVKGFSASKSFMCFEAWVMLAVESLSS
jgi:hypothetical protein